MGGSGDAASGSSLHSNRKHRKERGQPRGLSSYRVGEQLSRPLLRRRQGNLCRHPAPLLPRGSRSLIPGRWRQGSSRSGDPGLLRPLGRRNRRNPGLLRPLGRRNRHDPGLLRHLGRRNRRDPGLLRPLGRRNRRDPRLLLVAVEIVLARALGPGLVRVLARALGPGLVRVLARALGPGLLRVILVLRYIYIRGTLL